MKLKLLLCKGLGVLKMHGADCSHCNALQECWGLDMKRRLEELGKQETDRKPLPVPERDKQSLQSTHPTIVRQSNDGVHASDRPLRVAK